MPVSSPASELHTSAKLLAIEFDMNDANSAQVGTQAAPVDACLAEVGVQATSENAFPGVMDTYDFAAPEVFE